MKIEFYSKLYNVILIGCLLITSHIVSAQCTPSPIYTSSGIHPDTLTGLVGAQAGVPYTEVLTVVVPIDTSITQPFPITVTYVQIMLDSLSLEINGTSTSLASVGLSYQCSPSNCIFPANSSGCIVISGTPNINLGPQDQLILHLTSDVTSQPLGPMSQSSVVPRRFNIPANIDAITGTVYEDLNSNCQQDQGEPGIPNKLVSVSPAGGYGLTDSTGFYFIRPYQTGTSTVSLSNIPYWSIDCPTPNGTHTVNVNTQNVTHANNDFGVTIMPNVNDLQVILTNLNFARPGFPHFYKVDVKNIGTTTLSGNLELQHDGSLSYGYSAPAHDTYGSGTISWNYGPLQPGETIEYRAYFDVNVSAVLGDSIYTTTTIYPVSGDTIPADNVDHHAQVVQGSYDPNDKAVIPADGITPDQVANHQPLTYTIRFQNTGTDTAFTVVVRDTLSPNLEIESFEMLSKSHACETELTGPGYLKWTFNNILLPDSNVNEPASHGYIKYRIKPKSNLVLGDEIHNTAAIYFDFNAPVITNTTVTDVRILVGSPESGSSLPVNIYPNPTSDFINIELIHIDRVGDIELQLSNVSGQVIKQMNLNQVKTSISIDDLSSGFYFISLTENGEVRDTRKIVISRK